MDRHEQEMASCYAIRARCAALVGQIELRDDEGLIATIVGGSLHAHITYWEAGEWRHMPVTPRALLVRLEHALAAAFRAFPKATRESYESLRVWDALAETW